MNYIGIDLHKKFTHFAVLNEQGTVLDRSKIRTEKEAIINYLSTIKEPAKATLEATRNWYWVFDTIEPMVKELKLTAPSKVRLIAEATVKIENNKPTFSGEASRFLMNRGRRYMKSPSPKEAKRFETNNIFKSLFRA